ncbi:MAG: multidrug transporter, partial [Anaerolineales bacterium]|nr:multidrug transporter [Anaerolineales bacterium]
MKLKISLILTILAVAMSACGTAPASAIEPTPIPTVVADDTIISEGRLEPIHFTDLALVSSGMVSEVLLEEGDPVAAGDVIAR